MSVVEDVRQVLQDFLAPELREFRSRLDTLDKRFETQDKRIDTIENADGVRYQAIIQRLEQIQQSFAFGKRISDLEAGKTRSA
jgi:tetrahydromethanopterin S-methyltransferase subunit G